MPLKRKNYSKNLFIGELHYHLKRSGVRSVIENTIACLSRFGGFDGINAFVFASIKTRGKESIKLNALGRGLKIKYIDLKELDYSERKYKSKGEFIEAAERIAKRILRALPLGKCSEKNPFVLHCHNLSLAKNPALNGAIMLLAQKAAEKKLPIWFLLQCHDFVEDARTKQLRSIQYCTGSFDASFASELLYPISSNIFYCTINTSDLENLKSVGVPRKRCFLLADSVDIEKLFEETRIGQKQTRKMIEGYAAREGYFFESSRKILLYPAKAMRRKNIFEAVLLLLALNIINDCLQLLVTMHSYSKEDREYEALISKFVKKSNLPVCIGFGSETSIGLSELFKASSAVITTSIKEGFGFSFLEGWLFRKPVLGRRLNVCNDFEKNNLNLRHLYKRIAVPVSLLKGGEKRIVREYREKIAMLRKAQGIKALGRKRLISRIKKKKLFSVQGKKCIDFADLSKEMQLGVLEKAIRNKEILASIMRLNPHIKKLHKMLEKRPSQLIARNKRAIERNYGLRAKAVNLKNLISAGNRLYRENVRVKKPDNASLIERNLEPENITLLL